MIFHSILDMDELTDETVMPNLALNIEDDKRMCAIIANEDINVNDSQPGPSRRQQTSKLSKIDE